MSKYVQEYGQCIDLHKPTHNVLQLPISMIFANWVGVSYWILTKIDNSQLLLTI